MFHCHWPSLVKRISTGILVAVSVMPFAVLADTNLGGISFLTAKSNARSLEQAMLDRVSPHQGQDALGQSLGSYHFLGSVGGVAFGSVAEGENDWKAVELQYQANRPDGQRLFVVVRGRSNDRRVNARLFDWQLVPIARFAATNDVACFTLFGQLEDEAEQREYQSQPGVHILGYHSAFQNTLLGLRLMQADILIIRPDACDLPSENGRYLIGAGEQRFLRNGAFNLAASQTAFSRVQTVADRASARFRSYVVCDYEQTVRFRMDARTKGLAFDGFPYWYCWRQKIDDQATIQELWNRSNQRANDLLRKELDVEQQRLSSDEFARVWNQSRQQQRFAEIVDENVSANLIQPLPELSQAISVAVQENLGVNPVVYEALTATMRFAALFRHVKRENPDGYAKFVDSLQTIQLNPAVTTPNLMTDPNRNQATLIAR